MKIAILGTRGIPNYYGGFEQISAYLSTGLVQKKHSVTVYNSHNHPYQQNEWNGVQIIHCYDPEYLMGTAGQFIYDLNCLKNARRKDFEVILCMGYSSMSVWGRFYPGKSLIISNMDGLEWKRTKYSKPVRKFLRYAEKLAVKYSDYYIADSIAIQSYLQEKYHVTSEYIPYGAEILSSENIGLLKEFGVSKEDYFLLIARIEPENNIETILNGFYNTDSKKKFLVIGTPKGRYGHRLVHNFRNDSRIQFIGPVYDSQKLHTLKILSSLYFHGHSVGGTNPSLLEAMASRALIAAHDNAFNKSILGNDAYYFLNMGDVVQIIETTDKGEKEEKMILNNFQKIKEDYSWPRIIDHYDDFIRKCYNGSKK
jgi:glycosyltransferase involved in cell wall biosynthesis